MQRQRESSNPSVKNIFLYFLKLGFLGFGGAVIILDKVHRDLVVKKKWITEVEFKQGVAFTQFTPGPLATLVSTYVGFLKANILGATAAWGGFLLGPFIIVLGMTIFYTRYGELSWMQGALYGVGAIVIGVIASAVYGLIRRTVNSKLLWGIAVVAFIIAFVTKQTNFFVLVLAGIVSITFFVIKNKKNSFFALHLTPNIPLILLPPFVQSNVFLKLFIFFLGAGSLAFGGGLAILPYIQSGVVYQYHLISEKQFLDGVAIAFMTPGPVTIISVYIGYLIAGFWGAVISGLGMFLPVYIIAVTLTPFFKKHGKNEFFKAFINGVIAAAMGSIVSSIIFLGKGSVIDIFTAILAVCGFVLSKYFKVPVVILVIVAGVLGFLVHH